MFTRIMLRTSQRPVARTALAARPYHATMTARMPTTGPSDAPAPGHSATSAQHGSSERGNTTSHTASASQHNAAKDPKQDAAEAQEAAPGPEAMDGQYGGGNLVEGNYTKGSKEQKERAEAAKQGEK